MNKDKYTQKAAEILVESKYIGGFWGNGEFLFYDRGFENETRIDPFRDTLEGRRQADAIEDWLRSTKTLNALHLWLTISKEPCGERTHHQWRLDRIKWCLEQLSEEE